MREENKQMIPLWGPYSKKYMGISRIMRESRIPGLFWDFSGLSALNSFSYRRKSSSSLRIFRPFFLRPLCPGGLQPGIQILVAGGADTGLPLCVAAPFALLLLRRHSGLCQVVTILLAEDASNLTVFPEEAFAAGVGPVGIVPDPVNQNGLVLRFFAHLDILLVFDPLPGKPGNDKSPVVKENHHRAM